MYGLGSVGGDWGGALADLVRVPFARTMLFPIPDGVEPASIASVSDNVVDGWRTVGPPLAEHPGAPVLVVGSSSIGLYAVQCALALGAERVDYLDTSTDRLALAERLGANPVEGPPPRRAGRYPVTVDASNDQAGLACALRSTEPGGTCTSVGIYFGEETPVPLFEMYLSGLTFRTGRPDSCTHLPEVLRLIEEGTLDPSSVTSATVSFDDAEEAVADPPMKLVVERA
jgi:alcohol dehydrogenase